MHRLKDFAQYYHGDSQMQAQTQENERFEL